MNKKYKLWIIQIRVNSAIKIAIDTHIKETNQ